MSSTKLEKSTTITMKGTQGKVIEAFYCNLNPEIVRLNIISNRGKIKDVIEMPVQNILTLSRSIPAWHEAWTKEEE